MQGVRRYRVNGLRWRPDTGFELRCEDCAAMSEKCYWPLTEEFWELPRLIRCRACERARRARRIRERRAADPEWYAATLRDVRELKRFKNYLYNRSYHQRRKAREMAA